MDLTHLCGSGTGVALDVAVRGPTTADERYEAIDLEVRVKSKYGYPHLSYLPCGTIKDLAKTSRELINWLPR